MTRLTLILLAGSAFTLSACGGQDAPKSDVEIKAKAERVEDRAEANLAEMKPADIIDYLNEEAAALTVVLKTVTDEASAEAAVEDLRARAPKLRAAFEAFENISEDDIGLGLMRKLPELMKMQAGLASEIGRINKIPEARAVIEAELDKLELSP